MKWEKYYRKFDSLSESEQYAFADRLRNYGPNHEAIEVAKNFKLKKIEKRSLFI